MKVTVIYLLNKCGPAGWMAGHYVVGATRNNLFFKSSLVVD